MDPIILILVVLLLAGFVGLPQFGIYNRGYHVSGAAGFLLIVLILLMLAGRI